jgi:ADP-heptose:LPS heptosyltransferase
MKNILVVNRLGIGDAVLTTPLAQAIKQYIPNARVGFVVAPKSADLLKNHSYIDDIFSYKKDTKDNIIEQIKKNKYTDAIIVDERLTSSILAWQAGCKLRNVGRVVSVFGHRWLNPNRRQNDSAIQHYTEYLQYIYKDYKYQYLAPIIGGVTEDDSSRINYWINEINNTVSKKILIIPRGVAENKNWSIEHFGVVNEYLNSKGIIPIYTGAKQDVEYIDGIKGKKINIAGEFNLRELPILASKMDFCITVCTGPMHIVATTAIPMIALYGPTDPSYWAPRHATTVKADHAPCLACKSTHCKYEIKYDCMQRLTPDMVIKQINNLLENSTLKLRMKQI